MMLVCGQAMEYRPATFVQLNERLPDSLDRRLGYFGQERYVFFYYESRGEEVIWNDGNSYGFACGGWSLFLQDVAPLGKRYGVNLGTNSSANTHVLMLDRELNLSYFAEEWEAESFIRLHQRNERLIHEPSGWSNPDDTAASVSHAA
jgi:hypothetical protein